MYRAQQLNTLINTLINSCSTRKAPRRAPSHLPMIRTLGVATSPATRPSLLRIAALAMSSSSTPTFVLDAFAFKQFDSPEYAGTRVDYEKAAFEAKINELYDSGDYPLVDGYAPFCKHLFVPNFAGVRLAYLEVTPDNEHLLRSGYDARTEQELAVLTRWFPVGDPPPVSKFMDIILYSREQIDKETEAMGKDKEASTAPWGIISVKSQDVDYELPMQPITMMRNALGKAEGGSGVPLERGKYQESVAFWSKHAPIK